MSERPRRKERRKLIRQRHDSTLLIDWKKEFDPEVQPLSYANARMCHQDRGNLLEDCDLLVAEILELKKLLIMGLQIHDEYLSQIATCVSQDYGRLNDFPIRCRDQGIALDD